ncbi:ABC transporter G family member 40 [Zea mays]|uniref:ABC transporter G family member 40 n=1 Tax=Zea mays TaxID=4577 RepID=A0A1D6NLU7_MAIZE|nr:ABC transporter G family member 40 [Zea mays]
MDAAGDIQKVASMRRGDSGSIWRRGDDVFSRSSREEDDEEALRWAALEKLPTYDRVRRAMVPLGLGADGAEAAGRKGLVDVDVLSLGPRERRALLERLVRVADEDNERFLLKLKDRVDRVGIDMPTIEVRFQNLEAEAEVRVGSSGLPTVLNSVVNTIEEAANALHILPSRKRIMPILHDVSGIIKPRRMTLLLGPPGSGKTTLLLALAGRLDKDLKVSGKVTYNGHEMTEFVPERTAAYISQHDLHIGEMTVRETLAFSARCQGVGSRFDMLTELSRREKAANIKPDADIDAFMKACNPD